MKVVSPNSASSESTGVLGKALAMNLAALFWTLLKFKEAEGFRSTQMKRLAK